MNAPVANKESVLQRLSSGREQIKAFGVKDIGIFGSFAVNTSIKQGSDVDLLVDFTRKKKYSTISWSFHFSSKISWAGK